MLLQVYLIQKKELWEKLVAGESSNLFLVKTNVLNAFVVGYFVLKVLLRKTKMVQ
jgi:hypothetical protein